MSPTAETTTETQPLATAAMASLVGSLADNKAALGRRYAEWGVSAPTLESAVAPVAALTGGSPRGSPIAAR